MRYDICFVLLKAILCQHYFITKVKWLIKEYKLDVSILKFKINLGFQKIWLVKMC